MGLNGGGRAEGGTEGAPGAEPVAIPLREASNIPECWKVGSWGVGRSFQPSGWLDAMKCYVIT